MAAAKRQVKKGKKKTISVLLDAETLSRVTEICMLSGTDRNTVINVLLSTYVVTSRAQADVPAHDLRK